MYDFQYHRPGSLEEAAQLFADADDALYLAGGMTMIPVMKQRLAMPSDIIDLSRIGELTGITAGDSSLSVGAMTSHAELAGSETLARAIPALAALAGNIGDPAVRNRGTIGGSIANNDPSADYPAAILGLGATVQTTGREIAADDFFTDMFETALEEGELITRITFPMPDKAAYAKFHNPASRYAMAGVFVAQSDAGVRVAVTGAGACAFRVEAMEQALAENFSPDALEGISVPADDLMSDMHASAEYRSHLITIMARRAVVQAG